MSGIVYAALAGAASGGALLAGALIAWRFSVPRIVVASVMAFGVGVLVSALAFDLVWEAQELGGFLPTASGFAAGAVSYVGGNTLLDRLNARNRRHRGGDPGTGGGIAIGALLDGIPEAAVLGLSMIGGAQVSIPVLVAIIISNIPEGLSSTASLKENGRSQRFVLLLWGGIAIANMLAAMGGYVLLDEVSAETTAFIIAVAAGAIFAMVTDTMLPEAFQRTHAATGLIASAGFLLSFGIHQLA